MSREKFGEGGNKAKWMDFRKMNLNKAGKMIESWWLKVRKRFYGTEFDTYQIMPNHIHAIVIYSPGSRQTHESGQTHGSRQTHGSGQTHGAGRTHGSGQTHGSVPTNKHITNNVGANPCVINKNQTTV